MKKAGIFFVAILPTIIAICFNFLIIGLSMGIMALVLLFTGHSDPGGRILGLSHDTDFLMVAQIAFAILNIVVFGTWYYHRYEGDYLPDPRRTFHPTLFGGLFLTVPAAQFCAGLIVTFIAFLSPATMKAYESMMDTAGLSDSSLNILTIIYAVILGPIGEELIYRGVTMHAARQIFPFWAANLMQAVLFGVFHLNPIQGIYAFALGVLLGFVCEKMGSIYYSIFLHICFNFFGTVLSEPLSSMADSPVGTIMYFGLILITAAAGIVLLIHGMKTKKL